MRRPTMLAPRLAQLVLGAQQLVHGAHQLALGALLLAPAAVMPVTVAFAADPPPPASRPAAAAPSLQDVISPEALERVVSGHKPGVAASPEGGPAAPRIRLREGAKLTDRRGRFEIRGDRVIFLATHPDAHFIVLENLSLERVTRVLDESGSQLEWSVSGTITEFRASNYLQISRALVKSLPAKGEPRKLADPLATNPPVSAKPTGFTQPRIAQ